MKNLTFHIVGLTHNDVKGHEVEYAKNGRIHNSVAIIAIQHLLLEKESILKSFAIYLISL